jgi:hypothetical protein
MKLTRRVKRSGLLALAAVAAPVALAGIGASGAQASLLGHCTGSSVDGRASSLQGLAQDVWTGATAGAGFNVSSFGCSVDPGTPAVSAASSGSCLLSWHADGAPFDTTQAFCGSDAAPTTAQINTVNATVATGGSQTSVLTIPVAQSAIAIVVNPPAGCTLSSAVQTTVERVFRGSVTTWAGLGATGCGSAPITRVVRGDWDGETQQFKRWLTTQFNGNVTTSPNRSWADLSASSTNTVWPGTSIASTAGCTMSGVCDGGGGFGDEDEVQTIGANEGSIGYAALWAVRKKYIIHTYPWLKWIALRAGILTVDPSTNGLATTKARSNCPASNSAYGSSLPSATATWATTTLSTAGTSYPLCVLTYALALKDYTPRWGPTTTAPTVATTVHDYLNYVVAANGGQTDALTTSNDYAPLPTDVRNAATTGVGQITN